MTDRIESIANYSRLKRHRGHTSPKLVEQLKEDFLVRIEQGLEPQIVDVLAAIVDPAQADQKDFVVEIGDGNNRTEALMQLGLPVRVKIRMTPYVAGEVAKIRATTVMKRKNPSAYELASIVADCRREMKFKTDAETAAFLGISPATLSRILGVRGIPERLRTGTENLGAVVLQLCGKVRPVEDMEKALEFAKSGATRDQLELFIKRLKGDKRGPKLKTLRGKMDGREISISLKDGDTTEALIKAFIAKAKAMRKYKTSPPDNLGFLFA